jgi:hypothetical protein
MTNDLPLISFSQRVLDPLIIMGNLYLCAMVLGYPFNGYLLVLMVAAAHQAAAGRAEGHHGVGLLRARHVRHRPDPGPHRLDLRHAGDLGVRNAVQGTQCPGQAGQRHRAGCCNPATAVAADAGHRAGHQAHFAGPVVFRQRRYGVWGQEIIVYKFRSMTVTEDGAQVQQARRDDARVTPLGRILRRTSMDELPQFVNVLQGRMSIVGPRPHAVAHNEFYRPDQELHAAAQGQARNHRLGPGERLPRRNGFTRKDGSPDSLRPRLSGP